MNDRILFIENVTKSTNKNLLELLKYLTSLQHPKSMYQNQLYFYVLAMNNLKIILSPDWCGSVGWTSSCKPKGLWFNSWSGHMPGLWTRSPAGGVNRSMCFSHTSMSLFLSFFLLSPLSRKLSIYKL